MQAENQNGVPVIIMAQPVSNNRQRYYENMKSAWAKQLIVLGSLQIVLGALSVIVEVASIAIVATHPANFLAFVGHGIWIGIPFIVTGPFGIIGGKRKSRCAVITYNVMSIISASLTAILFGLAVPSSIIYDASYYYVSCYYRSGYRYYDSYYPYTTPACDYTFRDAGVAMEALLAIIAIAEAIVAIWSSVICCKISDCCCNCDESCCCCYCCCCCDSSPEPTQMFVTGPSPQGIPQQQPVTLYTADAANQPQGFYVAQQPLMQPYETGHQDTSKYTRLVEA